MAPEVEELTETAQGELAAGEISRPRITEGMSGPRKAAILCLSLGEDAAAEIFKGLEEEEIQLIAKELALLPDVKSDIATEVVDEFKDMLSARNYVTMGGVDYAKKLLTKSLGEDSGRRITERVIHSLEAPASFDQIQKTDPQQLAKLFQSEHPQTVALVLAHLLPESSAEIMRQLPTEMRADILLRMASLQTVSQEVVKRIAAVLTAKLTAVAQESRSAIGGIRSVADICNQLDRDTMRSMLEEIEANNPELSLEIRNLMVTFEDILLIDDVGIREILQRVDKKTLTMALKGTVPELQNRFFSNMSGRAVEMMKEEMDFMGQVKSKDVQVAQREVIDVLRELDEQGVISLGGSGGGDEYVS